MHAAAAIVEQSPEQKPIPGLTDDVLRAQRGDTKAFERLYRENAGRVHSVCLRIIADATMATELTQDVFVRAWQTLPSFRGEAAFSSWLHRIAVNVVLVHIRTEKRRDIRVTTVEDPTEHERGEDTGTNAEAIDLENAVASLPKQARAVFVLHDIEGYRHEEIAGHMGIAVGTSKAQLHRARMLLMKKLTR